jgi:hypothetical protein
MELTDGQHSPQLVNALARNLLTWYLIPIIKAQIDHSLHPRNHLNQTQTPARRSCLVAIEVATAGHGSLGFLPLQPVYEKSDSVNELLDITR